MRRNLLAMAASLVLLVAGAAHADSLLSFDSVEGPMDIHVDDRGNVDGYFQHRASPYREGTLIGNVQAGGNIKGIWIQETSNHPCTEYREGTQYWGHFEIDDAWGPKPWGVWGHCSELPNRQWNLRRR